MEFSKINNVEYMNQGHLGCPGCGATMSMRHALKVLGDNTVVIIPACCWSIIAGGLPMTALQVPLMHVPFAVAAACASGVSEAFKYKGRDDVTVMAWAGDGGTFDIGLQALSGAAERKDDFIYVCYDNEAYMNTGIQKSSATPPGAWTTTTPTGKEIDFEKKDIFQIVSAHNPSYIATASIAYPDDFYKKFEKAKNMKGFRFIHLFSSCSPGWKIESSDSLKVMRKAVESGFFILMEKEQDKNIEVTYKPEKIVPITEYLKLQGRYRNLLKNETKLQLIQERINKRLEKFRLI